MTKLCLKVWEKWVFKLTSNERENRNKTPFLNPNRRQVFWYELSFWGSLSFCKESLFSFSFLRSTWWVWLREFWKASRGVFGILWNICHEFFSEGIQLRHVRWTRMIVLLPVFYFKSNLVLRKLLQRFVRVIITRWNVWKPIGKATFYFKSNLFFTIILIVGIQKVRLSWKGEGVLK